MQRLELTLETPAENLALDEALLDWAEAHDGPCETLRLWESPQTIVVAGSSSRLNDEVELGACRRDGIPVLRRSSGGAAIVAGPGCLMYAVVLSYERRPELRSISRAHNGVLNAIVGSLQGIVPDAACAGTSDVTQAGRKFSGNSMRCKRHHFLYHGTLLYDFPLELVERYLKHPPRQPAYRQQRPHRQFIANLPLSAETLRAALIDAFAAHEPCIAWPRELTRQLAAEKFSSAAWTQRS